MLVTLVGCGGSLQTQAGDEDASAALGALLASAKRIPNRSGWFEILRLPNRVYALWEPGHSEQVNAFLVLGRDRDLLYDTGMGIASVADALDDVRRAERLPDKPLTVVLSHNHLDHNGGIADFGEIWTADNDWARKRLRLGVPPGSFEAYWADLRTHPGVAAPDGYDPSAQTVAPYPLSRVRYLTDGQQIDLGDRAFTVVRTHAHSPDGIALYDPLGQLFFGGDAFYGPDYLVTDMALLAADLERAAALPVRWHYASHGAQLIAAMRHGKHLVVVRRMLDGDGGETKTTFVGTELPVRSLDGVTVTLAKELLLY